MSAQVPFTSSMVGDPESVSQIRNEKFAFDPLKSGMGVLRPRAQDWSKVADFGAVA